MKRHTPLLAAAALLAAACGDRDPITPGAAAPAAITPVAPLFDDVSNNIDLSIDAAAETMPLTAPGASGSTQLYISPTNGDGKNGCNLTGSTTLVVAVGSSNGAVATVSPSSITFGSCGDIKTLTVTPVGPGTATVSISQTSNNTGATFNLAPATFTVNVTAADVTGPVITPNVSGTLGNAGWYVSNVTVTWTVTDPESAISSSTGCGPTTISADTPGLTLTCSATSAGGTTSQSVTIKRDATAPTISGSAAPPPNGAGWNNTNVTVSFTCADATSGVASCTPSQTLSGEGAGQSASGTAIDNAGNSASTTVSGISIDKTAPVVTVTGVTNGATYILGSVPAPGCTTSDALSGVATSATLAVTGGPVVGTFTATCSGAADVAGNPGSASATYTVIYAWAGFFQPVDMSALNSAKAGNAIPIKFSLGGNQGLAIMASGYPASGPIACSTSASATVIEGTETAGGSTLTYDATANQYVYAWKTEKAWAGTCRQLVVKLIDGTSHTASFQFK